MTETLCEIKKRHMQIRRRSIAPARRPKSFRLATCRLARHRELARRVSRKLAETRPVLKTDVSLCFSHREPEKTRDILISFLSIVGSSSRALFPRHHQRGRRRHFQADTSHGHVRSRGVSALSHAIKFLFLRVYGTLTSMLGAVRRRDGGKAQCEGILRTHQRPFRWHRDSLKQKEQRVWVRRNRLSLAAANGGKKLKTSGVIGRRNYFRK